MAHLKEITEKDMEMSISNCVIGVPSYFVDSQRRAYLNVASIAGLKPLRLIHDCTATAHSYGIYKFDFANKGPTHIAFIDIGHCDTQCLMDEKDVKGRIKREEFEKLVSRLLERITITCKKALVDARLSVESNL
ncbi:hypothetical protein SAY86_029786 [Trapa natans]|uniref:Uncharacterized protein n=1 Tax=Trapa natans TaxID=22666 RepID=A0AAN7M1U0_TRANT|nr:hypothetical protein SAY86_029786 [Trapa natans]